MKIIILLLCLASLVGCGFEVVNTGHRGVKVKFGKVVSESLSEGLYFYNPLTSQIFELSIQEFKIEDKTSCYTKDLQQVDVSFALNLFPEPSSIHIIYANIGRQWAEKLVPQVIQGKIKEILGQNDAVDLVSQRQKAADAIRDAISATLKEKMITVKNFEITNMDFNDKFENAIEAKVVAVQNAEEAKNKTIRIQEEAKQKVIAAKAEAESMSIRAQALAQNKNLVEYEAVQKWDGKLPQYVLGGQIPFIQIGK